MARDGAVGASLQNARAREKTPAFNDVFQKEISLINERRADDDPREDIELEVEAREDTSGSPVLRPNENATVVGLAFSGGGIRSAAFCLGALQALYTTRVLHRVDYLSTVSGGGYIGCSLTAAFKASGGDFPFQSRLDEDETPSLQHIRDHSNYLFSNGAIDLLHNASIYARGLVANGILILQFVLAAAALTLFSHAGVNLDRPNIFGIPIPNIFSFHHFVITAYLSLLLGAVAVAWGVYRSVSDQQREPEIPSVMAKLVGFLVLLVLFSAFCELQPYVLGAMFTSPAAGDRGFLARIFERIDTISVVLAPFAAAIAFLASKLGEFIKSATESSRVRAKVAGYAAKAAVYFAALLVPFLLWVLYLDITFWGMCINAPERLCSAPGWLGNFAYHLFGKWPEQSATLLYLAIAVVCILITLLLRPNANSLHPLYRDHLAKAFLFRPQDRLAKDQDLAEFRPRLSELSNGGGPYHLINAALNIQESKAANKRGRNADFFLFSPEFVGSKSTGYVATRDIEGIATGLDLATAMAVSGAAASSNMGAESIKPMTPTLALLNIRLGYWLRNPAHVTKAKPTDRLANSFFARLRHQRNFAANYYFILEMLGLLDEKKKSVYLTDGGHIENLGIYELLRRRCRIIIAVDAEADPEMAFGSLNTLERYARIDLGVGIELRWQQITDMTRATSEAIDDEGNCPKHAGPHCAIGEISYPENRKGILIYIKSSLTGDENDYIFHYKKRYDGFPHETTLDQMFSEEQFEVYRALGFHAAYGLFDRSDAFAHLEPANYPSARDELALLDWLFPRVTTGGTPKQRQTFVGWLPKAKAAKP